MRNKQIADVTFADVKRVAREIIDLKRMIVTLVGKPGLLR